MLKFKSYLGTLGDTYDRYLIRMLEMGESLSIINVTATFLLEKFTSMFSTQFTSKLLANTQFDISLKNTYLSMEELIAHFCRWQQGNVISANLTNTYIESPKGEFGVTLSSNNSAYPQRCKIRSPSYHNLQALPKLTKGHYLADLAALIGTIDIVFGEIDR